MDMLVWPIDRTDARAEFVLSAKNADVAPMIKSAFCIG